MSKKYIERYWREPKQEDLARKLPFTARCKDTGEWRVRGNLTGYTRNGPRHWEVDGSLYETVQVYDAPDPGEGYELIDPTIEKPGPGIEFLFGIYWHSVSETAPLQASTIYRRKIQPVATAIAFPGIRSLCRPLAKSEEITSADIFVNEKGQPERAYTAVGQLQSNADHQYYRELNPMPGPEELKLDAKTPESFGTTTELRIIAEKKPEAAEPVTFVAHPIQINDKLEYCFKGKPIQFRSYAVLNEQGHYLQHLPACPPQYAPEFRQAFTPLQLLQLSVRELGSNIRLRAVEPVDVDKLKQEYMQELREKLQPKVPERGTKREKVMWQGREYYVLTRFRCVSEHGPDPMVRAVLQPTNDVEGSLLMVFADDLKEIPSAPQPEAPQPGNKPKYVPFKWDDRDDFCGKWIEHKECKKAELVAKIDEINGHLLINDKLANDILEDWRFVRYGEPVGKRVED